MAKKESCSDQAADWRGQAEEIARETTSPSRGSVPVQSSEQIKQKLRDVRLTELELALQEETLGRVPVKEDLRLSETKFRALYDSTSDAVMLLDDKGFFDCNKATMAIFGCTTREEFCRKHPSDLSPPQQPGGTDSMVLANEIIAQAMEKGSIHFEWMHKRNDTGETFPADVLLSALEIDGRRVIQAVVRNISERRQAEDRLVQQYEALSKLNRFAVDLSMLSSADNLEMFIAKRLKEIAGATFAIFSEYNAQNRTLTIQHIELEPGLLGKISILLGKQVKKIQSVVNDETYRSITTESIGMRKTLHEITFGAVPKPVGSAIQVLLHADRFIGLAYLLDGKLYGTSMLAMSKGQPDPPRNILESFISLVAVALRRKQAETALRESEGRYKDLVEHSFSGVYVIQDERFVFLNNNAAASTGYSPEELIGNPSDGLVLPEDQEKIRGKAKKMLSGEDLLPYEFRIMTKSGQVHWIMQTVSSISFNGRPAILGNCIDITERRQREVQDLHSQKLEAVGQLAAGIAHEINTPIQFVGDNINFMKDAFQDILSLFALLNAAKNDDLVNPSVVQDLLSRIQKKEEEIDLAFLRKEIPQAIQQSIEGLERVSRIVLAMREFSHPGGKDKTDMDINKAIESTVTLTHNEWKYSAELTTSLAPNLPVVRGYPADFNQVILNIIINASQALQEKVGTGGLKKGRIEISTRQDDNEVEICIRDTGTGIPPEAQARIFDPFFTTKDVGKGTGQGLAIAQNIIVHKHGGRIYFETKPGVGTAFYIRLPLDMD